MSIGIEIQPFLTNASHIVDYLMPLFNFIAGVSLGFVVINKLLSAFRSL